MGRYRVLQKAPFMVDGNRKVLSPGEIVQIDLRADAEKALKAGLVTHWTRSHKKENLRGANMEPYRETLRVGFWITTSVHYSGGRIHLYQFAVSLSQNGCEVFIVTDRQPRWAEDYPLDDRLKIVIDGVDPIPEDIDVLVTDSKGSLGKRAYRWVEEHPGTKFVCFNFETPNWVAKYCPDYAGKLQAEKSIFKKADFLLSNSNESNKHLLEWLETKQESGVLEPAVNTFALKMAEEEGPIEKSRPFAVWSGRSAKYKNCLVAAEAIRRLEQPFDLIAFGQPSLPENTEHHRFISKKNALDVEKYRLILGSDFVLAPSLFEGYGMVPAEALACGKPCVAFDLPVLREAYGDSLVYAQWNDTKDFYRKVKEVAEGKHKVSVSVEDVKKNRGLEAMQAKTEKIPYFAIRRKVVSVQLLVYWGFIPESLESVYPYADEIFVAYGPTPKAPRIDDGSLELLKSFPDPDKKIRMNIKEAGWPNKHEMRNWCLKQMKGNYHILLDGDEVWTGLDKWLKEDLPFWCPRWVNFWHDGSHWISDTPGSPARWGQPLEGGGSVCPHYRCSFLRPSYYFRTHPTMVDRNNQPVHRIQPIGAKKVPEARIYHFGHALSREVMQAKHDYYLNRDGNDAGRRKRKKIWHEWNGEIGNIGDGIVKRVDWELPNIVLNAFERLQSGKPEQSVLGVG